MMAFPSMLVSAAIAAKMPVPSNPDEFDHDKFPHFAVFCTLQLARPMKMDGEQFRNAKVITKIPEDKIKKMTLTDFIAEGLEFQS